MNKKPITKEILSNAEIVAGLRFNDKKREQMLGFLNRFLTKYIEQRKDVLGYNIEPPIYFNPQLPDIHYVKDPQTNNFSKLTRVKLPSDIQKVVFYSLCGLAWLIKHQKLSSMDLTHIYLMFF